MKPEPAPSALPDRLVFACLRWAFAWIAACLLTAGMLLLLSKQYAQVDAPARQNELQVSLRTAPDPAAAQAQTAPRTPHPSTQAPAAVRPAPLATPASTAPARTVETPAQADGPERITTSPPDHGAGTETMADKSAGHAAGVASPQSPLPLAQRCPQQVKPVFPKLAQEDGVENGRVLARLHLDADGRVREVSILEATPRGYFEASARAAALKWRCLPPAEAGETLRVPFVFGKEAP